MRGDCGRDRVDAGACWVEGEAGGGLCDEAGRLALGPCLGDRLSAIVVWPIAECR